MKRDILSREKDALWKYTLEEIKEADFSEYESSTVDGRIFSNAQRSNEDFSNPSSSFNSPHNYNLPQNETGRLDYNNLPILYIDIKISNDQVSRLVLYRNQTPHEAAEEFITVRNYFFI